MNKLDTSSVDGYDTEVLNIHTVQLSDTKGDKKWTVTCFLVNKLVNFRIDTGANCNAFTLKDYQKIPYKDVIKIIAHILQPPEYITHVM